MTINIHLKRLHWGKAKLGVRFRVLGGLWHIILISHPAWPLVDGALHVSKKLAQAQMIC